MRLLFYVFLLLACLAGPAQAAREPLMVPTPGGGILVESIGTCASATCPAVLILSGTKGFASPAYDEMLRTFQAAGLNAYLVHVLSVADLAAIAAAGGEPARLAYYARHWSDWISAVQGVAAYFRAQPQHGGKVGLLGISLGAQLAAASSAGQSDIDALVLVDGGFPDGYAEPIRALPPLLLIWGGADRIFPLPIGQALQRGAQRLGGPATLDVYADGAHGFFLKAATPDAAAAHRSAAEFLRARLSAHPPF